ncbi:hypothetical protein FQR65_LT12542 [Abscondita terminalis]|nr:hypothetical protein FQR65_LT12542 [Abscondita terminalis]
MTVAHCSNFLLLVLQQEHHHSNSNTHFRYWFYGTLRSTCSVCCQQPKRNGKLLQMDLTNNGIFRIVLEQQMESTWQ